MLLLPFFFFHTTSPTDIYTLSLHDALPIYQHKRQHTRQHQQHQHAIAQPAIHFPRYQRDARCSFTRNAQTRSEEHTSELQSQFHLVCRLLLEKKKTTVLVAATKSDVSYLCL